MRIGDTLDLAKVRKNWDRAAEPPAVPPTVKLADVRAPIDAYEAGRALLARIRATALARFEDRTDAIEPFFTQADALLARMEAGLTRPADVDPETLTPEALATARKDFQTLLGDMEDLFEVFAGIGR